MDKDLTRQVATWVGLLGVTIGLLTPLAGLAIGAFYFLKKGTWFAPTVIDFLGQSGYAVNHWSDWRGVEKIADWLLAETPIYLSGPLIGFPVAFFCFWLAEDD